MDENYIKSRIKFDSRDFFKKMISGWENNVLIKSVYVYVIEAAL